MEAGGVWWQLPPDHIDQTWETSGLAEGGDGFQSLKGACQSHTLSWLTYLERQQAAQKCGTLNVGALTRVKCAGKRTSYFGTFTYNSHIHTHKHTHTHNHKKNWGDRYTIASMSKSPLIIHAILEQCPQNSTSPICVHKT